jgi:hypothetical protein
VPCSSIVKRTCATLTVALACAVAQAASAQPRVVVASSPNASPLLREALVRTQGELSAVGLGIDVQVASGERRESRLPRGVYGLLELDERGSTLLIRAWAPRATRSLTARVELGAPGVTAEVVAVRAVETLRAAMLQFAEAERGAVPTVVRGFTRFEPAAPAPASRAEPPSLRGPSPPLSFWAGPSLSIHAGAAPDLGVQLGVLVGARWAFAGAAFESTLVDLHVREEHGSADVRRQAAWLQLGARFRTSRWEVSTRTGVGYAAFSVSGTGDLGYRGNQRSHGSLALMLGVSSTYWATRSFGLYGSVGARLATDAPSVLIAERRAITLDRPSFVVSLGASVGVF